MITLTTASLLRRNRRTINRHCGISPTLLSGEPDMPWAPSELDSAS
jgi:hypothetical protein